MTNPREHLEELVARITRSDPELAAELRRRVAGGEDLLKSATESAADLVEQLETRENVVFPFGRPAVEVVFDRMILRLNESDAVLWHTRLTEAQARLEPVVRAVGRIEMENHFDLRYAGTGFLLDTDVVVTNFHVARAFARRLNGKLTFRRNLGNEEIRTRIDFLEETGNPADETFRIAEVLYMEEEPDIALLRVDRVELLPKQREPVGLPPSLLLSENKVEKDQFVVTIGYPGRDPTARNPDVVARLFGENFEKKRLSPGQIKAVTADALTHDCSTLSGSSGSPVVDLATGRVVGLHVEGQYDVGNSAIPAARILYALNAVQRT
ncbi:MAG TPA: serine protease, partial [Longimicrobium sp.]|nr:serine protease [Longimicrobium sp.]